MSKTKVDCAPGGNFKYDPGPPPSPEDIVMAIRVMYGVTLPPEEAAKVWRGLKDAAPKMIMTEGTKP